MEKRDWHDYWKMGLSNVARLQQGNFFDYENRDYVVKKIGSKLMIYKGTSKKSKIKELTDKQIEALTQPKFTGYLSTRSQKKILSILQNWIDTIDYLNYINKKNNIPSNNQIIMITLTLSRPQQHDDQYIKRHLLNRFIIEIMREFTFVNYLWKAEPQKNGNIHFHILVDKYIPKNRLQIIWNNIQADFNYHDKINFSNENLGLPSTRIESLNDKNDAIAYTAKYISKNENTRAIGGRIWGCSRKLPKLEPITVVISRSDVMSIIDEVVVFDHQIYHNDYCIILQNSHRISSLTEYLFDSNKSNVLTLNNNIEKLNSRALTVELELRLTDWYNELINEESPIMVEYALANDLFTSVTLPISG